MLLFVALSLKNKDAMTCLARRVGARHKMAVRHERAEGEDGEMKPEPTMAGEKENTETGLGLDHGFHRQSVNVVRLSNLN